MKGPSPFSTDQYTPLLCLWGIKSLKHKGGFCIKIQTMVHKTFFSSHSLALCFILSLCIPFNFPLLKKEEWGYLMKLEILIFSGSKRLQEANNQSHSNFFLSMFSLYLPDGRICCSGW